MTWFPSRDDHLPRREAISRVAAVTPRERAAALWPAPTDRSIPVAAGCEHSEPGGEGTCAGDCSNTGPN
ncbi:hypothetical protein GCM10022420_049820 [Streptomyces iranensis]